MGSLGSALSVAHEQHDLLPGVNNTLFLQTSTGHAALSGKFEGLGDATTAGQQPGKKAMRIADALNWQRDALGGEALVSY